MMNAGPLRLPTLAAACITCLILVSCKATSDKAGNSCTVASNGDHTSTIHCPDGTHVTISDGAAGTSCSIADNGDGTKTISCADGTVVTVGDGAPGSNKTRVADLHGLEFLLSRPAALEARTLAQLEITGASAAVDGHAQVDFTVHDADGVPVLALDGAAAAIARLAPPPTGEASTRWIPYGWRVETVSGAAFPRPAGSGAPQAVRDAAGDLVNHGDGSYTYHLSLDLLTAGPGGTPVGYVRSQRHRVGLEVRRGGAVNDATFDFVPDDSPLGAGRAVVSTAACLACHGLALPSHAGGARAVDGCATCHVPGAADAQGGASLDLKVMIHKIHMGGQLPSVAGPDGDPWATADNGTYALWGEGEALHTWWRSSFPAVAANCAKCHDGAPDGTQHASVPGRDACGSCHDDVDFASGGNHLGGAQASDDQCALCHSPSGGVAPVIAAHQWWTKDPRNVPEFEPVLSLSPPANGQYYTGTEAPTVTLVLKRNGVALGDHRLLRGSAQGCVPTGTPTACPADTDGKFAATNFFVHGPRAARNPVLTTKARAQILATSSGPFTFATPTSVSVTLDQGADVFRNDAWATRLPGTVTVPLPAATYTSDQLATLLNGNTQFATRAIAFVQSGRLGLRSRNLGPVHAIRLAAGSVTTDVFAGDTTLKLPGGSTASVTLASAATTIGGIPSANDDPKVTLLANGIEYQLDPVQDLAPGTYVVSVEISQLGRVDASNYQTPSVATLTFQVGTAVEEKPIARNCDGCHQGPDGRGLVLDVSRHDKLLGDLAVDQCGACHDLQPQDPSCPVGTSSCGTSTLSAWTGARPLGKRVHAVHFGSRLFFPLATVDYTAGDSVPGRDWDITLPQDPRACEACHPAGTTSGSWATRAGRLACGGCHDGDSARVHMQLETYDPTPTTPWSGDEQEACTTCH